MRIAIALVSLALAAAVTAAVLLYTGIYNTAATQSHTKPVYWLLATVKRQSVERRADDVRVPPLDEPGMLDRGLALYRANCLRCHAAPGVAPEPFALGLVPVPSYLGYSATQYSPAEIYWLVKHGIKSTGMPAWQYRMSKEDLWAIVAFIRQMPLLSPAQYEAWVKKSDGLTLAPASEPPDAPAPGSAKRGRILLHQYACVTCHVIPGVVGGYSPVGPPLADVAERAYLAGVLRNTPENMVRWIRSPQHIDPRSAMPDLGVTEEHARDMTAYLYSLRQ